MHAGAVSGSGAFEAAEGDVVGLAASVDAGKIALSKNGSWEGAGCGVVFEDAKIRAGIYPALSCSGGTLVYRFAAPFLFGPPGAELW